MDRAAAEVAPDSGAPGALWKRWAGYLFALACAVWVFHDIHPKHLWAAMVIRHWPWVIAAVGFDVLTYLLQGIRWRLLLETAGHISVLRATQAIYIGLFTNEIVPLRLGEVVRAILAAQWMKVGLGAVVPSVVVERFLDAVWLVLAIGVAAMFVPLPRQLERAGDVLGTIVIILAIVFVLLVVRREDKLDRGGPKLKHLVATTAWVSRLACGVRNIGILWSFYVAAAISAAMLTSQALALWFMMRAYGLALPVTAGAVVFVIIRLGTAIPNAPANVGSFQFFTVLALSLFGVDKTTAAAFSVVDFAVLTAPLWAIGLMCLANTGTSLSAVRARLKRTLPGDPQEP